MRLFYYTIAIERFTIPNRNIKNQQVGNASETINILCKYSLKFMKMHLLKYNLFSKPNKITSLIDKLQ